MKTEREALIARLRLYAGEGVQTDHARYAQRQAANMLEADKTQQEPIAYLAWRDGKPCWEGEDCVCEHAVYPVDHDDDRTSMPVYLAAPVQRPLLTDKEIIDIAKATQTADPGTGGYILPVSFARAIEAKLRGEA